MEITMHMPNTPDDEQEGRLLNDGEYLQVLKNRDDIFLIENETRVRIFEASALLVGVIFGIWLSTVPMIKVVPHFYPNILRERTARLARVQNSPAIQQDINPAEESARTALKGYIDKPGTGLHNLKSNIRTTKPESAARTTDLTAAGRQTPLVVLESMAGKDSSIHEYKTEEDTALINLGDEYKKQGDHAEAFSAFRHALMKDPRNTKALAGMGDLFLYTGLLDSAAAFYKAALAVNPRNPVIRNDLGSVHYYISTLAANPHYAARMKISDPAHYIKSQYDSAIAEYTNAISIDSTCVDAMTNRGVIRAIHGDHTAAIEDYTHAIKINPSWADAYSKRAATYKTLGNYKDAVADYTAAIKLDSSTYEFDPALHFANAYFGRGTVYYRMGDLDKAIADYDNALALEPKHSMVILNKAFALGDKKRYDSAIGCYTQAIALLSPLEYNGTQERAYSGRGLMYNLTGKLALALGDFNEAIRLNPDDHYAYFHRGNALKAQGKYDEAVADYTNALASPQLAAKACWRIAECYALKQNRENAMAWLKKSIFYGFTDFKAWEHDRDLSFLWSDKEFHDLTKNHNSDKSY